MSNLKELKNRITSVKSTQKITSAMKMVAASRLKRAQEAAEAARPYAERMGRMMTSILENSGAIIGGNKLLSGTGSEDVHLIVVVTSDRGLCGGFNSSISRESRRHIRDLKAESKNVKILCVGRKGRDQLKLEFGDAILDTYEGIGKTGIKFDEAQGISGKIIEMFDAGKFDICTIIYNRFVSVISQEVTSSQIIPVRLPEDDVAKAKNESSGDASVTASFEFEPSEEEILTYLLPLNLNVQMD